MVVFLNTNSSYFSSCVLISFLQTGVVFHWLPRFWRPNPNLAEQHVAPATTAATKVGNEEMTSTHRERGGDLFHPPATPLDSLKKIV